MSAVKDPFWGRYKVLKTAIGTAILALGVWGLYVNYFQKRSFRAFLLPPRITVRAEVAGIVEHDVVSTGQLFASPKRIGQIRSTQNEGYEDIHLATLRQRLSTLDAELQSLSGVANNVQGVGRNLKESSVAFQAGRTWYLDARTTQLEAKVEAARARADEARRRLERSQQLSTEGLLSDEALDEARRNSIVAERDQAAAIAELDSARGSIRFARRGINLDGSTPDKPYTQQRLDEVNLLVASIQGQLAEKQVEYSAVQAELKSEDQRLARRREVALVVPANTRVWRILATSNEFVTKGQPILELSDCSKAQVLAWLTERTFERVHIGSKAQITMDGSGQSFDGEVANIVGSHISERGFWLEGLEVVNQSTLERNFFGVVISAPGLSKSAACENGKAASVLFI